MDGCHHRGPKKAQDNLSLYLQHLNSSQVSVDERFSRSFVIKEEDGGGSISSLNIDKQEDKVTFMMNLF